MRDRAGWSILGGVTIIQICVIAYLFSGFSGGPAGSFYEVVEPQLDPKPTPMEANDTDTAYYESLDKRVVYETNSEGFRDEEWVQTTNSSTKIALVGDSWTLGQKVGEKERFEHILEQKLNNSSDHKINTLNFGRGGLGILGKVRFTEQYVLEQDPDGIIIQMLGDDFVNRTDTYNRLKEIYREKNVTSETKRFEIAQALEEDKREKMRENREKYLKKMVREPLKDLKILSERENVPVCIFYIPTADFATSDSVKRIAVDEGLTYLEVGKRYRQTSEKRKFEDGTHPSRFGHRKLADLLLSELAKKDGECTTKQLIDHKSGL